MRPRLEKGGRRGFWGRVAVCNAIGIVFFLASLADAKAQQPEASPGIPEAEIETSPIPGTEIPLEPQLPPSEAPLARDVIQVNLPKATERPKTRCQTGCRFEGDPTSERRPLSPVNIG